MTEQPYEIFEPLVIPKEEIATVINWIKAEQVRVIQQDRTLGVNKIQKVDWLTETVDSLTILQERASADNGKIASENKWRARTNERLAAEAAAAKTCFCDTCCACKKEG